MSTHVFWEVKVPCHMSRVGAVILKTDFNEWGGIAWGSAGRLQDVLDRSGYIDNQGKLKFPPDHNLRMPCEGHDVKNVNPLESIQVWADRFLLVHIPDEDSNAINNPTKDSFKKGKIKKAKPLHRANLRPPALPAGFQGPRLAASQVRLENYVSLQAHDETQSFTFPDYDSAVQLANACAVKVAKLWKFCIVADGDLPEVYKHFDRVRGFHRPLVKMGEANLVGLQTKHFNDCDVVITKGKNQDGRFTVWVVSTRQYILVKEENLRYKPPDSTLYIACK